MDYLKIGQRIRRLRRDQNLSQEQLAEKVWISPTHMSHIETGQTKLSLPVLVDLASVLNVSTDELLSEEPVFRTNIMMDDIISVLGTCTPKQLHAITEIVKCVKLYFDESC